MAELLTTNVAGNVSVNTGGILTNIASGLIQTNTINLVIQTIAASNANVVLSANGTANAVLSNTGNLTLTSGNLVTSFNVVVGNVTMSSGGANRMNLAVGTMIANNTNLVLQTLASSNQNVVLSANGTANATLGNTGNLTLTGNLITTFNIANAGNLLVTQNTFTGNLSVTAQANITTLNATNFRIFGGGAAVIGGVINLNFISGTTINATVTANGASQGNVTFTPNVNALTGTITTANASNILVTYSGAGATIDTRVPAGGGSALVISANNGSSQVSKNINFVNTSSVTVAVAVNGGDATNANVSFVATGLATPIAAGADKQIQFNEGGTNIGANANLIFTKATSTLNVGTSGATNASIVLQSVIVDDGLTVAANTAALYVKNVAGKVWFFVDNPSANNTKYNNDSPYQHHEGYRDITILYPSGVGTTVNTTCFAATGTVSFNIAANSANSLVPVTNANPILKSSIRWLRLGANCSLLANANAWIIANSNAAWSGNGAGSGNGGGFIYIEKLTLDTLPTTNVAFFAGMCNLIAKTSGASLDPTTNTVYSMYGIGANSSTGNWQIILGQAGASRNLTDAGTSFNINTNDVLEMTLFTPPGGAQIGIRLRNQTNGAEVTVISTSNTPLANTWLQPTTYIIGNTSSGSVAAQANLSINKMYLEKLY